jgi:hypothetical protein
MFKLKTEQVAYWYFRLNGCIAMPNVLIHDRKGQEKTEVDVLAVRFPNRRELALTGSPMVDDPCLFAAGDSQVDVIIAEVKRGTSPLNSSWTDPEKKTMEAILYYLGAFDDQMAPVVADSLRATGAYVDHTYRVRLCAVMSEIIDRLATDVVRITWAGALNWVYERLHRYHGLKAQHRQWDDTGERLYAEMIACKCAPEFVDRIMRELSD